MSLADFRPESVSVKWYNILSFRFLQPTPEANNPAPEPTPQTQLPDNAANEQERQEKIHDKQESEVSVFNKQVAAVKEESSDESTIISSQTSTLTRNQGIYSICLNQCIVLKLITKEHN